MDILGTKRLVALIEQATGAIIPQAEADLAKLATALDAAGVLLAETTDLVQDADKLVEELPEHLRSWGHLGARLVDHFIRVGTRASNAAQDAQKTSAQARDLLKAIHERGFKLEIPKA